MNKWLLVALLWGVALLNYLDRQVVFSLFPLLSRDLGASAVELGLLSTVFLWTYGVLSKPILCNKLKIKLLNKLNLDRCRR